jgi:lipid-binding SYLF domain-containing protein
LRKWTLPALLLAAIAFAPMLGAPRAVAQTAISDQQKLVNQATGVIRTMRSEPGFAQSRSLLQRAKAVMIVPELTKGGLIVGGQGGAAVLLARLPDGGWSDPAFFSIGGGTFGLQAGVQQAQMVFFIMTESALQSVLRDQVTFGGQNGIAVFVVGQEKQQSAITQDRADIIVWARATGAYAGITVEGTSVTFNRDDTAKYYGRPVTADGILHGTVQRRGAGRLRTVLAAP